MNVFAAELINELEAEIADHIFGSDSIMCLSEEMLEQHTGTTSDVFEDQFDYDADPIAYEAAFAARDEIRQDLLVAAIKQLAASFTR